MAGRLWSVVYAAMVQIGCGSVGGRGRVRRSEDVVRKGDEVAERLIYSSHIYEKGFSIRCKSDWMVVLTAGLLGIPRVESCGVGHIGFAGQETS